MGVLEKAMERHGTGRIIDALIFGRLSISQHSNEGGRKGNGLAPHPAGRRMGREAEKEVHS